ncbi:MAG TPA: hypothetical protein VN029_14235 [Sphingomonas sp.]|nr:hypothetical protein [Sphingomonas sp.]
MAIKSEDQIGFLIAGMVLVAAAWSMLSARAGPVSAADIRSISGCYVRGEAVVRIERDRIGVLASRGYREMPVQGFSHSRGIVLMAHMGLRFDPAASRLIAETGGAAQSLTVNGQGDDAYLDIWDAGHKTHVTLVKRPCPVLS